MATTTEDEVPPKASRILARYYRELVKRGVPERLAADITQDAAFPLHRGECRLEVTA